MQPSLESRSAWTEYWKTGHFESLPEDRAAGALGSLDAAWAGFFSSLPDHAKLLDIATGGADVVRRALSLGRGFRITGIDLADLSAVRAALDAPSVELIGNHDVSLLPFEDDAFGGVMSQFGIEYADAASAPREAVRVLARGGRGHFVLHHAGSAITQGTAASLAADRLVFGDGSVFSAARSSFEIRLHSASGEEIGDASAQLLQTIGVLQSRLKGERAFNQARRGVDFLANLAQAPTSFSPADALSRIAAMQEEIRARMLRKQAQIDSALDRKNLDNLTGRLAAAGALVQAPRELRYPGGRILGWSVSFHK